ncbi:hypothetical protein TWF696_000478 [Orbilia brochopaga]|uniref:Uncharacterized protein n=1 Tax=Orbilia brochopaga TaxID=3140254 RepID=A0AAV9VEZ3_9PEZI
MQLSGKTHPGKIPVSYRPIDDDMTKITWVAAVNITGRVYDLTVDNTLLNTWLYAPTDPYKCVWESKALGGVNYCYWPPDRNATEQPMYMDRAWPFTLNYTGPGGLAVSGSRVILNNITAPGNGSDGASWPSIIGLIDNTYDAFGSGSPPDMRLYHGSLSLSKTDHGRIVQGTQTAGQVERYPQTPFNNYTSLTYFTTNFNPALPNGEMSIGMGYMNDADYTGEFKTVATSPESVDWRFDANENWTVKIWENITTTTGVQEIVRVVPFPTMNMTASRYIVLDLSSRITFVDFDTAEAIYKAFDGSCTRTPTPMGYSSSQKKDPSYPYCTLPIIQRWNNVTESIDYELKTPGTFSLPWGPDGDIMIADQLTLVDALEGRPCANEIRRRCEGNAFGSIQPNSFSKGGKSPMENAEANFWVYGDLVFKNAYLKWDTANGGSVSMAKYASPPMESHDMAPGHPKPNAAAPHKKNNEETKHTARLLRSSDRVKERVSRLSGKYGSKATRQ